MTHAARRGTTTALTLTFTATLASSALAHAGVEHSDPITAILHQGTSAIAITLLIIALVGTAVWLRRRHSSSSQVIESEH
jgi:hypothetical protein